VIDKGYHRLSIETITAGERPLSGRVSDAGRAQAINPVYGPGSESLRRKNPRESGEQFSGYGDLTWQRVWRAMVSPGSPGAGSC